MKLFIKKRGISLLEVMFSLAIIAIILVMATRYFSITRQSEQINESVSIIENLRAASSRWLMGHADFTDISLANLVNLNLVPAQLTETPWGTSLSIAPADDVTQFKITFASIPNNACEILTEKIEAINSQCQPITNSLVNYVATFKN